MSDRSGQVLAEYVAHLVDVTSRFGVRPEQLLRGTGIRASTLEKTDALLPRAGFYALVMRALELSREPGLGFHYGMSLKLSAHGQPGLLAMTSGTLRDALMVAVRFVPLRVVDLSLAARLDERELVLEIAHNVPRELQVFASESFLVSFTQMGRSLVGHTLSARCSFPFAEPAHFKRFAHLLPPAKFGAPTSSLSLPLAMLDRAVVTSDSVVARRIERELSRELATLDERATYLSRVRSQLRPDDIPSLEELAERLDTSTRTLKRKLAAHGTSYRALVEELRRARALTLLREGTHTMTQIAGALGYTDRATFHRAYRRWFGTTPRSGSSFTVQGERRPGALT
ncbi:MAG TPA: AraC family transcriptional regulator ligand-binding domain-containing protein [Polyangiales bacterium]|nr:AraC family transcriptional regulator ligand-binding domain-containing protein [Polyangiales bacterium]